SCVNVPSPDQPDDSSSSGMVNGHQAAKNGITADPEESVRLEHPRDGLGTRILSDRSGYVAIRVRIPVQSTAKQRADDSEVSEVSRSHDPVRRTIEIE